MIVTIKSTAVRTSDKGRRDQEAHGMFITKSGDSVEREFWIGLAEDQPAYPVGVYQLLPSSFYVDRRFRSLAVWPRLEAVSGAIPQPITDSSPVPVNSVTDDIPF